MIPISLYVSAEMVRVVQAKLMEWDVEMYYPVTDTPMKARTSNLNEELGQVHYVFSDKTGTLTCNTMEFLKCSAGGVSYGHAVTEAAIGAAMREGRTLMPPPDTEKFSEDGLFYFDDPTIHENLRNGHPTAPVLDEFLRMLALCHTVIPETAQPSDGDEASGSEAVTPGRTSSSDGTGPSVADTTKYMASSPDEGALVEAARGLGYKFASRSASEVVIEVFGKPAVYTLLHVLEFNSTRKRMSVIVRTPDGNIKLYCKGADSVIYERLAGGQKELMDVTSQHLEEFARDGLRTLVLAVRDIPESEYTPWAAEFVKASATIINRKEKVEEVQSKIECELVLLGATAIEDKLQDGVADTIQNLLHGGIKVWVLTGDKQETAINIGYSCALLYEGMSLVILDADTEDAVASALDDAIAKYSDYEGDVGLVIDGATLEHALAASNAPRFLQLGNLCKSVICCRVSPLQKALVVGLVKDSEPVVTLAIGDGANDVSMIQAAHIGIGISGNEGMQAVMASDYAIAQFKYLKRLLLIHGRWNYQRISKLILYSFYKNMTFVMPQFWFALSSAFSGQTLYHSNYIPLFNVLFAGLPIIILASIDQDVSHESSLEFPELYFDGQNKKEFNVKLFVLWIANAIFHSAVIFFGVRGVYSGTTAAADGQHSGVFLLGSVVFTCVVLVVTGKLALEIRNWTWYNLAAVVVSLANWFVLLIFGSLVPSLFPEMYWVAFELFADPRFWLTCLVVPVTALVPDLTYAFLSRQLAPRRVHIIQEMQKSKIKAHKKLLDRMEEKNKSALAVAADPNNTLASGSASFSKGFAFSQDTGQSFAMALMPVRHVAHWRNMARKSSTRKGLLLNQGGRPVVSARSGNAGGKSPKAKAGRGANASLSGGRSGGDGKSKSTSTANMASLESSRSAVSGSDDGRSRRLSSTNTGGGGSRAAAGGRIFRAGSPRMTESADTKDRLRTTWLVVADNVLVVNSLVVANNLAVADNEASADNLVVTDNEASADNLVVADNEASADNLPADNETSADNLVVADNEASADNLPADKSTGLSKEQS
ncbi:uncharacterized protein AMSG_10443 [Thecamonas trahens ATCC 50062]|uniref:Phospholipid-transporting ATPase n=1 Tax=Thecamonas trahens ATCC 50062 TaxID=461836 RepID=A0A0L0DSL9_THETB|nr:hypothetical protein AMSG_10443 [Thecamonas trahens ATCC 50062]KNC54448.1 hypothetical protein AMSG_10443 [Thecamonas trahens ATCC 50062]|eukprot:XP_013753604.1 hypothetical protein AMSG_10443 [Thecamonas trahens ATCC 50062]